ncbi:glycosyltransferase [Propioniciclava soli]|uniref:Glycosyltransferase n=1 Tax=Propioniciclava soli TaxID=2775081 RepID=A0ABZ3CBM2_9ACTN
MSAPVIVAVVVAYRSAEDLPGCLAGLLADPHVRVVVVDNADEAACRAAVAAAGERATYLAPGANLGYGRAANRGVRCEPEATHVAIVNPDVRLVRPLSELLTVVEAIPGAVVAGVLGQGPGLNARPLVTVSREVAKAVIGSRAYRMERPTGDAPVRVEQLDGALLVTSVVTWRELGGFDERFELYYEDVDLCRRAPGGCWLVPQVWGEHAGGASFAVSGGRAFIALRVSRLRYLRVGHGLVRGGLLGLGIGLLEFVVRGVTRRGEGGAVRRQALRAQVAEWWRPGHVVVLTPAGGR